MRGVSGGERKRVTIAEACLSGAPLQCWDNSTRGLDSANAIEFCKTVRLSAELGGCAACVAIYQGKFPACSPLQNKVSKKARCAGSWPLNLRDMVMYSAIIHLIQHLRATRPRDGRLAGSLTRRSLERLQQNVPSTLLTQPTDFNGREAALTNTPNPQYMSAYMRHLWYIQ